MNYNRRSTRPDAGYYRETRKIRGAARARSPGGRRFHPAAIVLIVLLIVAAAWWVFRR